MSPPWIDAQSNQPGADRLTELEIKQAFTEDLLEKLEAVVIDQQRRIDQLVQELARMREQLAVAPDAGTGAHERPPHY